MISKPKILSLPAGHLRFYFYNLLTELPPYPVKTWKSSLILLSLILITGAGIWIYKTYFSLRKINNLELINQDAIFVFESYKGAETWNQLAQDPVFQILTTFPAFQRFSNQLTTLDSLTGGSGKIARSITGKQVTISLHPTGLETFDLLFALNLDPENTQNLISEIKTRLNPNTRLQSRKYSDIEIVEYFDLQNNRLWSFSIVDELVLISPSSFLLEEAIRFYLSENTLSYFTTASRKPYPQENLARLHLSGKGLSTLLKGVSQNRENSELKALEKLNEGLILNLSLQKNKLTFEGALLSDREVNFTPSIKANLQAIEALISNRTISLAQYNLQSIFETQKLNNLAFVPKTTLSGEIQRMLLDKGFFDALTGEIYYLNLEDLGDETDNSAVLIRTVDPISAFDLLKAYQKITVAEESDFYLENEILHLLDEEFPAHLFGGKFMGFEQTFASVSGDILILTNTQQAMKIILDDHAIGNTWSKFPKNLLAKNSLNPNTGFSKIILLDQIWNKWTQKANPSWSSYLQKYGSSFRSFPLISLSINQVNQETEASLTIHYQSETLPLDSAPEIVLLQPSKSISFASQIQYGPRSILNFLDQTEDVLIQDSDNKLYLINSGGETVFSVQLNAPIVSDAFQVDYYKNGKLQILVATDSKIYGIDRLGNPLPGYPVNLADEQITHLNLIDYSSEKDYRYFISTAKGNLYLLDKTGKQLDGWNPMPIGEKTIAPPTHIRVPGKGDILLAQTEAGKFHLFSRRGEKLVGSPFSLGSNFNSPVIFKYEPTTKKSYLVGITSIGEIINSDLEGQISYRNQLIKEDKDHDFQLVQSSNQTGFVFVSRQYNQVTVLDSSEKSLFSAKHSDKNLIYQYFDFGSDRQIFALTDQEQEFCYLYDLKGIMMTAMPLESKGKIQITYQPTLGQFLIRTIRGDKLIEFKLAD